MIGCGDFASRYHLPAILNLPDLSLRWICEVAPSEAVKRFARNSAVKLIQDPAEMYADARCDAVVISIPHTLHYSYALDAIRRGRHLLVDKPLTTNSSEAAELADAADRAGVIGAVAFNRRLDPGCIRAREIIASGGIGKLSYVIGFQFGYQTGWVLDPALAGGGIFWGRAIHLADLVPWLTQAKPARVRGHVRAGLAGRVDYGGTIEVAFDGFDSRLVCDEDGWRGWDELRIYGEQGMIELRRPRGQEHGWGMRWECEASPVVEQRAAEPAPGAATRDFIAALKTGSAPACTLAAAVQSVALIEAAFRSAAQDGTWIELPI